MPCHFPLLNHGSMSATAQNCHMRSRWSRGSKLDGECVPAQLFLISSHKPSHAGKILLQLAFTLATLSSLMESVGLTNPLFLDILALWNPLHFHQMGCCLYLEVKTQLLVSGMYKLVGLSRFSKDILAGFALFPFHRTAPQLLQDLKTTQFACGTPRQGSANML